MLKTLNAAIKSVAALRPVNLTSTTNGLAVDTNGFDDAQVVLDVGVISGTPTLDVKMQESDVSGSGYTDISGATFAQITTADQHKSIGLNLRSLKRYIRPVCTVGGGTPDLETAISVNLGTTDKYPVTQP